MPFIAPDSFAAAEDGRAVLRRPVVKDVAARCLQDASNDKGVATQLLLERLESEYPDWWSAMQRDLVLPWLRNAIHSAVSTNHAALLQGLSSSAPRLPPLDGESARAMAVVYSWYDFHVSDGVSLGTATRADLNEAIQRYDQRIAGQTRARDFLNAVRGKLTQDGVEARTVLSEKEIAKLAKANGISKIKGGES